MPSDSAIDLPRFDLLQLADGPSEMTFCLTARNELCTPFGFLYGGSGIAASVEASERATGRPLQWITTQFIGAPKPDDLVEFEVSIVAAGRSTTQTRVTASANGHVVLASLCAHNIRPDGDERAFHAMPDAPTPDACPPFEDMFDTGVSTSFFNAFDRRIARGLVGPDAQGVPQTDGIAMWARLHGAETGSAATQSFVADVGPVAVCAALGTFPGGTSLDNTVRIVDPRPSEWVLVDVQADGLHRSVGHTTARLWSADGRLLGIAQQSAIIRTSHHHRSSAT